MSNKTQVYTRSQCNNSTTNWLCSECLAQIFPFNHLDDASLDLVIFENIYGTVNFDADRLENLCFNPLDYLHRASDRIDLGPDCSFLKENSSSCDYFFEGQLNELLVTKDDLVLSILHLNARSLYGNFGKFNPFAPEPPVTARADPLLFYPL